jgi:hypothetical protein
MGRPALQRFENGDEVSVKEWFDGTDLPKKVEVRDRHGLLKERWVRRINAGNEGSIPFDLIEREHLGWTGTPIQVEQEAYVRGTDILLTSTHGAEKTYYDLSQTFEAPLYTIDSKGHSGVAFSVQGHRKDHVLRIHKARLENAPETLRFGVEQLLVVDSVNVGPNIGARGDVVRRSFDRQGLLIDERFTALPSSVGSADGDESVLQAISGISTFSEHVHYRFQPGWLTESIDPRLGRVRSFSQKRPTVTGLKMIRVNDTATRQLATEVNVLRPAPSSSTNRPSRTLLVWRWQGPRELERNPYLADSTNLWTSWSGTAYDSAGEPTTEAEAIFDAQGEFSASRITPVGELESSTTNLVYRLPEPDQHWGKEMRLSSGTNSIALDLGSVHSLTNCAYVYFYVQDTNHMDWTATFKSAAGKPIQVKGASSGKAGEMSFSSPTNLARCSWSCSGSARRSPLVGAPRSMPFGAEVMLISVPELARAGLDLRQPFSATVEVRGKTNSTVRIGPLSRLARP